MGNGEWGTGNGERGGTRSVASATFTVATSCDRSAGESGRSKLEIRKAVYGALVRSGKDVLERSDFQAGARDVTEILRASVKDGRLDVENGGRHFGNPAPGQVKFCRVTYALDGVERTVKLAPSDPIELKGAWDVSFPDGRGAPEKIRFDALMPWNHHVDSGIKFYAGTAVYECKVEGVKCKVGERVMLDLGEVHDFAEVTVNGKKFPVLWRPPFCIDITDAVASSGDSGETLSLEIKVTNRWPNRFIGDELLHDDDCEWTAIHPKNASERRIARIPDWVENGEKSPTGRRAFSTWKHWKRDERLLDSGLIGPVAVRFGYSGD